MGTLPSVVDDDFLRWQLQERKDYATEEKNTPEEKNTTEERKTYGARDAETTVEKDHGPSRGAEETRADSNCGKEQRTLGTRHDPGWS
ncbi:hypothetical protein NDU88_001586 [Pleurodeles waltl]|uniref:Uncharacterized protein n=1 Tax=Pleurodeles waltl TaxID=8319 RepID=A0AAV7WM70_PLEWA|nr:hypothetical protein NDU88_001586 [Pleurodeles waltl]